MKKIFTTFLLCALGLSAYATSTGGSTTRNVSIDGNVQTGGTNGSNSTSWENNESTATSNGGVTFYMTWDATNLYVAWRGGNKSQQHILWIDTDPATPATGGTGTRTTFSYGNYSSSSPGLPFTANFFVNIQDNYNEYRVFSGGSFPGSGVSNALTVSSTNSNDVEAIIPWSVMGGRPASFYIISYINDSSGGGGSGYQYGFAPSSARSDGNTSTGRESAESATSALNGYFAENSGAGSTPFQFLNGGPLPVNFAGFEAKLDGEIVTLEWATLGEKDNAYFEIARSKDALNYSVVGQVEGSGTVSSRRSYRLVDYNAPRGTLYYRLTQVDTDGTRSEHPRIRSVVKELNPNLTIFPNPSTESVRISGVNEAAEVGVYDANGKLYLNKKVDSRDNEISLKGMPEGIYLIRVQDETATKTLRVAVKH
jgi:Secretion system C-terminal sorting domain